MIKIVLDTNIIVSALNFAGKPGKVFDLVAKEEVMNITSRHIIVEVENVLTRKFFWPPANVEKSVRLLNLFSKTKNPKQKLNVISHDPDNRILECALAGRVDFIITGDKYLLDLGTFRGIEITTPAEFLDSFADLK